MIKEISIRFLKHECLICKEKYHLYYILPETSYEHYNSNLIFDNEVLYKVKDIIRKKNLKFGEIKYRYSKTTNGKIKSFGCPKCDTILRHDQLDEIIMDTIFYKRGCIEDIKLNINSINFI